MVDSPCWTLSLSTRAPQALLVGSYVHTLESNHHSISEIKSSQDKRSRLNIKMYAFKYEVIELNPKFNSQMVPDNLLERTIT